MTPTKVKPQKPEVAKKVVATKTAKKTGFKVSEKPYGVAVPEAFSFKDHKPLRKKNFENEALFYEHKAAEMDYKRGDFLGKAEEARKLGSPKERAKKRQIIKLQEKMSELRKQLEGQGIDVDALLQGTVVGKK